MSVWYAGGDFGQVRDSTSFAVLEESPRRRLYLTLLRTWKPERPDCLDALPVFLGLVERDQPERVLLALDARGLGQDAAETALSGPLGRRCEIYPLLPSHSDRSHRQREDGYIGVGKKALFGAVVKAIESGELELAQGLAEGEAFVRELEGLRPIRTKGGTSWTYSHADQSKHSHDDRVSAVANALFLYRYARAETALMDRVWPANRRTPRER